MIKRFNEFVNERMDDYFGLNRVLKHTAIEFLTTSYVNKSKYPSEDFFTMKDLDNICETIDSEPSKLYVGQEESKLEGFMQHIIKSVNMKSVNVELENNGDVLCYPELKSAYIPDGDVWLIDKNFILDNTEFDI